MLASTLMQIGDAREKEFWWNYKPRFLKYIGNNIQKKDPSKRSKKYPKVKK